MSSTAEADDYDVAFAAIDSASASGPYNPTFDFSAAPTCAAFIQDTQSPFKIIIGPVGSGKTTVCLVDCMKIASEQMVNPATGMRHSRIAMIRNTSGELKTTTIKSWEECWPPEHCGSVRMTAPMTHRIVRPSYGILGDEGFRPGLDAEFIFIPLDKPKDVRHLRSLELTAAYVNEVSEVPPAIITMLRRRIGRFPKKVTLPSGRVLEAVRPSIIADMNEVDEDHWMSDREREAPQGWSFFHQPPAVLEVMPLGKGQYRCIDKPFSGFNYGDRVYG